VTTALQRPPATDTRRATGARRVRRSRLRRSLTWFAIPSIALVLIFFITPFVLNLPLAFTSWSGYSPAIRFNGFTNFELMLERGILQNAVGVTLAFALIGMVIQNTFGLGLALMMQQTNRVNSFFRSVYFIPVLISPLAGGYIWRAIVDPQGPLNAAISVVIPGFDFAWLGHPVSALVTVAFIDAWKWTGLTTLVYIAGLNSVPSSLLEAASIDGASRIRSFFSISFPLLAPAFTFNVVTTLVGSLSAYDIIASTTSGGPGTATTTLNVALQQQFGQAFFGTASAISLTVTVLVILIAVPLVAWLRRREVAA
jgi:raffinose/stachyose/melibiose transport system permease protein